MIYFFLTAAKARFFSLVDLRDFFSDLGSGTDKNSENDQLTGQFQSFIFHFQSFFFLISPEQTDK